MKFVKIATVLFFALAGGSAHADIVNGNFEAGLNGWTTSGLSCSGVGSDFSSATGGCVGMDTDFGPHGGTMALYQGTGSSAGGVVSQSVATTIGTNYNVDFWLAQGAYNGNVSPNYMVVDFSGQQLLNLVDAVAAPYVHYSFNVTAGSNASVLSFKNQNSPSFWILDDVSVTEAQANNNVPEPASIALLGLALAGMLAARSKRRAK